MEEKTSERNNLGLIKSLIMVFMFIITIAVPLTLTMIIGTSKESVLDYEVKIDRPSFSMADFLSRKYQDDFELWFSRGYPLRDDIVILYNKLDTAKDNIQLLKPIVSKTEESDIPEPEPENIEPKFPEYVKPVEELLETQGYKGTGQVIIGKSGVLYENGYINEYLGFAQKYVNVTDEQLINRVEQLKFIQDAAVKEGKAFMVVITPSKATNYPEYIPDWYLMQHTPLKDNYVRPYVRLKEFLKEYGVNFVDSQDVYKSVGMTNVFPKTGIHWNRMAACETVNAMIAEYERQMDKEVRHLEITGITKQKEAAYSDQDIFGVIAAGRGMDAIVDDWYYYPKVRIDDRSKGTIPVVFIQGGSFCGYINDFLGQGLANEVRHMYYNNGVEGADWKYFADNSDLLVIEVNEQFVYAIGGPWHQWAEADFNPANVNPNVIEALYNYVRRNWVN